MLAEEPDVRKALVRFREGLGGNLRGAPSLLDLRLVLRQLAAASRNRRTPDGSVFQNVTYRITNACTKADLQILAKPVRVVLHDVAQKLGFTRAMRSARIDRW